MNSFASIIKLFLKIHWACRWGILWRLVCSFNIVIVEVSVHILIIIHPCSNLMWITFMEMLGSWSLVQKYVLWIVANMVRGKSIVSPKDHFTPQVRVLSTFVHGGIWLEVFLDIVLVFSNHSIDFDLICIWVLKNLIKISSDSILFIVETIKVHTLNRMDVLCL